MSRKQKSKFNVSYAKVLNFLRSIHRWKKENPQQRTNALFSRLFEGELQFHVKKEPQNDPKMSKKKQVFAVVRQISEFLLKVTKTSLIVQKSNFLE